jgi:pyrimidine operon attenuation protein / uracil phosphoribosyltransferase
MRPAILIDSEQLELIINRLCFQLIENHDDFSNSVIIGLQPRGVHLAALIVDRLKTILKVPAITYGTMDITFHRDDFRRRMELPVASSTDLEFEIEDKKVILVDDVLYTGRTIRAGLDAMLAFGRPSEVELLTLIDRRFSRELPIRADYVGKSVDSYNNQRVIVELVPEAKKNQVILLTSSDNE